MKQLDVQGKKRQIAVVIFFDQDLNILVQDRTSRSKSGEKYGFWGGGIEEGETAEQGLRRELMEELAYEPEVLDYWGYYTFKIDKIGPKNRGITIGADMFLSPITDLLLKSEVLEGDGKVLIPIDEAIANKDLIFGPISTDFLIKVKKDILDKYLDAKTK